MLIATSLSTKGIGDVVRDISAFGQPKQKLALRNERFYAEIWPKAGGGVACLEYLREWGGSVALFCRTIEKNCY